MSQKESPMDMSEFFIRLLLSNGPGRFKLSVQGRSATIFRISEENNVNPMISLFFTPTALKECMQVWNGLSDPKLVHVKNDIVQVN